MPASEQAKGVWYSALAYALWGFFPIYWKFLSGISPLQLTCHRIVWSCVVLLILIGSSRERQGLWTAVRSPRVVGIYAAAAMVIAVNWMVYVWAVVLFFRERLRRLQWVSVLLAAAGVLYLAIALGSPPWIALFLAASFGSYGLLKKVAPLSAVQGLTLETAILFPPAAGYLIFAELAGRGALLHSGPLRDSLMFGAGPLTTVPLLLFAAGLKRTPLAIVGMLQYISPTMQALTAVFIYHEPFTRVQMVGFGLVWAALALFALDGYVTHRWPQLSVTEVT
jgi:chloramphenicol-sensitive protein RarD